MSAKHQIFSSNPKTKRLAKRKWRRQARESLANKTPRTVGFRRPFQKHRTVTGDNGTRRGGLEITIGDLVDLSELFEAMKS